MTGENYSTITVFDTSQILETHTKDTFQPLVWDKVLVWLHAAASGLLLLLWCRSVNTYLQCCGEKLAQGNYKVTHLTLS